jgi:hypothetical protein
MNKPKYFIDNTRPIEVEYILRAMPRNGQIERQQLLDRIAEKFSFRFQKRYFDSFNRLIDLDLLSKIKDEGIEKLKITGLGGIVKEILDYDTQLYREVIHFLHYSGYEFSISKKPYFWSYKKLCDLLWEKEAYNSEKELAGEISLYIQDHFKTTQTPFDESTIQKFLGWLKILDPPITQDRGVKKRYIDKPELFLLSTDLFYRTNGLHYGDPVLLTPESIESICKPFFISIGQFDQLVKASRRIWTFLRQKTGFQGLSIILDREYSIVNLIR